MGVFRAGGKSDIPALFNFVLRSWDPSKTDFELSEIPDAFEDDTKKAKEKLIASFSAGSIESDNALAGGAVEVGLKQRIATNERFLLYIKNGYPEEAARRAIEYLETDGPLTGGSEEKLEKMYDQFDQAITPKIPPGTYEETYFTNYEFRKTFGDAFSINSAMGDYTDQIYMAWRSGLGQSGTGFTNVTNSSEEAVKWMVYYMYYERARITVAWVSSEGDGITDIPDAIANRAEYKRLLAKEKAGTLNNIEEAMQLEALREAAAKGDLTNIDEIEGIEDVATRLRFSEQTILMRNLKSFASNYTSLLGARKEKYKKTYLMFGEPSEMVNKLTLKPGMSTFLNFRTDQISQLAPKFKLYQVTYDKDNKNPRETEYKFANKNNIRGEKPKTANILESRGREAVGVKSFEWKYIGTNPATARNDLTAQLNLYFQSFDDLFQERIAVDKNGSVYNYRYVDLILRNPILEGQDEEKSCTIPADSRPDSEKQKPEKFETKIIVGWNFRGTELEKKVKADSAKANSGTSIITDLSYFNEVLFMTLIDHEFGIEEDGTFNLTITYRARLDALMQDKRSDILATTNIIKARATFDNEIAAAQKKCEQSEAQQEALKRLKDDYEEQKNIFRMKSYQSIINELNGAGEDQSNSKSPKVYHISIDLAKFAASGRDLGKSENFLYKENTSGISVGTEFITQTLGAKLSENGQTQARTITGAQMVKNNMQTTVDNISTVSATTGIDNPLEIVGAVPAAIALAGPALVLNGISVAGSTINDMHTNSVISSFEVDGELAEEDINEYLRTTVDIVDGKYNIHYFFFGDLIELLAMRVLGEKRQMAISAAALPGVAQENLSTEQLDNIRILLGTMEWFPRAEGSTQAPYRVNIAALPISLMVYKNFMLRRVVAKKRDIFSLLDFIRDFLKYLLDDVLGANSEDSDESLKLDVEIKSSVLTMPGKPTGINGNLNADPIQEKILENEGKNLGLSPEAQKGGTSKGLTLDLDLINEENTIIPYGDPESNSAARAYHYLTVYVENKTPSHLRGYEEDDRRAGIYHFHIGGSKGIFKRASFKKTDATYLREARFTNQHYNPLATLSNVYDVDMEMFGNTIFYPGQYLFINPFGLGKSLGVPWDCNSFSNIMGLGGYHLVTEVSSVMDEDGFSTSVQARYETSGDGKKYDSRSDTSSPNCEAPPATEIK